MSEQAPVVVVGYDVYHEILASKFAATTTPKLEVTCFQKSVISRGRRCMRRSVRRAASLSCHMPTSANGRPFTYIATQSNCATTQPSARFSTINWITSSGVCANWNITP
jgi:hypothetical protein